MARRGLVASVLLLALLPVTPASAASCRFQLGFAALAATLPAQVGACLDEETHDAVSGDAVQHTAGGLLAWRKADNWTAFTNGYLTWVNGPRGVVRRLNSQRFPWEANPDNLSIVQDIGAQSTGEQTVVSTTSTANSQGSPSSASNVTTYRITASQTSDNGSTTVAMNSGGNGSDASSTSGANNDASGAGSVVTTMAQGAAGVSSVRSVQQQGTPGFTTRTGNVVVQGTSSPASSANGGTSNANGAPAGDSDDSDR